MKKKLFFTWSGIGDNLVLMAAARNYQRITGEIPLVGSKFTALAALCPWLENVDWCYGDKMFSAEAEKIKKRSSEEGLELVFVTCSGYKPLLPDCERNVNIWPANHMITRYVERMGISGDVEIEIPLQLPQYTTVTDHDVCIMTGGMQKYKAVAPAVMQKVVNHFRRQFRFVQLGGRHDVLLNGVEDKRGCDLIHSLQILQRTKFLITGVGGLSHLARAAGTKAVILQTNGEPMSCCNYSGNIVVRPVGACGLCGDNLRDPQHQPCFYGYQCVRDITSERVIRAIEFHFEELCSRDRPMQVEYAEADPVNGLEDFYLSKKTLWCDSAFYRGEE